MRLFVTALAAVLSLGISSVGHTGSDSMAGTDGYIPENVEARSVDENWGAVPGYAEIQNLAVLQFDGIRARREARMTRWIEGLTGAREAVFQRQGFPYFRYYVNYAGDLTEIWTYPNTHRRFTFRDGALIHVERFYSVQFAGHRTNSATYRSGFPGFDAPATSRISSVD